MYNIPFSKMLQPRLGTTWAYNQKDTIFVSYARYNPAASSLPRAASWDRNLLVTQNADFDANGNLFAVENVASSSGKLFVPGPDAAAIRRVAGRDGQAVHARPVGARLLPVSQRHALLGGHEQQRAHRVNPPPGIPQALYIPNLSDQLAQIGSGSSLRHRRARWRVHRLSRADGGRRIPQGPRVGPGLVHAEPLLRQLRPGRLDDRRLERREHLHRVVEHRRRRRAPAVGQQARHCCAATGRTRSRSTVRTP